MTLTDGATRSTARQVGTVCDLLRYPVKSMAAEQLDDVTLGWHGVVGDRRYAFVQDDDASDFPWLTIRQVPTMDGPYQPVSAPEPESGPPTVRTPAGRDLAVTDADLRDELEAAHGSPVSLLRSERGVFDVLTVSVMSRQTVDGLGELTGSALSPLRFRPNIVVDAPGDGFPEDAWVGQVLTFGDAEDAPQVRLDMRDARCMVINFDHATAERDPAVLRAVAQQRQGCLGVYGSVQRPGVVAVGTPIYVSPPAWQLTARARPRGVSRGSAGRPARPAAGAPSAPGRSTGSSRCRRRGG